MLRFASLHKFVIAGSLVLATAACDGIGDGVSPVSIEIIPPRSVADGETFKTPLCFAEQMVVLVRFSDGTGTNYAHRDVRWTSSNPDIVEVSNGDLRSPDDPDLIYARSVLVPRSAGTATVQVDYVGMVATYEVEVIEPQSISLSATRLAIAPNTGGALTLSAVIDGEKLDVTRSATWTFVEGEDAEDFATIGSTTGVVMAKGEDAELTAQAKLALCPDAYPGSILTADVVISRPAELVLTREFADAPNDELVKGTTDALKVIALLESGDEQDLTSQATYTAASTPVPDEEEEDEDPPPRVVVPGALGVRNLMSGFNVGTDQVKATWTNVKPEGGGTAETLDSNWVPFTVVEDTVAALAIDPADGVTLRAGGRTTFTAKATYTTVPTRTQFVTRHVAWSSSDTEKIAVGNGLNGGLVVAGTEPTETPVEITAKVTIGSGDTATTVEKKVEVCVIEADAEEVPEGCPTTIIEDDEEEEEPLEPPAP